MANNNIGVLTEQGFVEGSGLGFTPIDESELNKDNKENEQAEKVEK